MYQRFANCLDLEGLYVHIDNDASYYLNQSGDTLCIFFEWSNGKTDWRNNFNFPARPYRKMKDTWFCHRGFLKVWKSIEPYIAERLFDTRFEDGINHDIKKVEIVGYSHGGAIAQLCYEYVRFNRPDVMVLGYGYGAPRVFWGFARKAVKERFKGFVVVRNGNDLVTHLPPILFGFRHICEVMKIGKSHGLIKDHYPENYLDALWVAGMNKK